MFLNNKLFEHGVCSGTIWVITKVIDGDNIEVAFPITDNIVKINVQKEITYFTVNGIPASRKQFPIQNAFALTVHKMQGLTLPHSTMSIDKCMFAPTWRWAGSVLFFDFN